MDFVKRLAVMSMVFIAFTQAWGQDNNPFPKIIKKGEPITLQAYEYYKENSYYAYYLEPEKIPTVTKDAAGEISMTYSDGRVLTVGVNTQVVKNIELPGKITEITCLPLSMKTSCNAYTDLLNKTYSIVWKSHPDSTKIGKAIQARDPIGNFTTEPFFQSYLESYEQRFFRYRRHSPVTEEERSRLEVSRLQCDSQDWYQALKDSFAGETETLRVNEWVQESMQENPETMISENRTGEAQFGVHLEEQGDALSLTYIEYPTINDNDSMFLFFGDVIGLNFVKGPEVCNLSFNFDSNAFISAFQKSENAMEEEGFKPVRIQEWSDLGNFNQDAYLNANTYTGVAGEYSNLHLLDIFNLITSNTSSGNAMVDVIMLDGSIESLEIPAVYYITPMEVVE